MMKNPIFSAILLASASQFVASCSERTVESETEASARAPDPKGANDGPVPDATGGSKPPGDPGPDPIPFDLNKGATDLENSGAGSDAED